MKPRIFIGSSTEGLGIAYAIQENLQFDANITVWTQGIFQLSSNTLDDLIKTLSDFDFAIMVFKPDDLVTIREKISTSVRDNVIFELGLFIGRLGKECVFFVIPHGQLELHIPTDLLGVNAGYYDSSRDDGNLKAGLGPFCNQVRERIKTFVYENLNDIKNESKESKKIALEKPRYWEYLFAASLIESRLIEINKSYSELDKGLVFIKFKVHDRESYNSFFLAALAGLKNLFNLFYLLVTEELEASFGPKGVPANILEIKGVADKFNLLCKNLIEWEYSVLENIPPDEVKEIQLIIKGWSKTLISEINKIPSETRRVVAAAQNPNSQPGETTMRLSIKLPENFSEIHAFLDKFR